MNKRDIITICGVLGSGKSTAAKRVAGSLGYKHFSGGDFMRSLATKRNMTLLELSDLAESDPSIDKDIDATQKEFMDANDRFVIDSRLGWYWAPDSFKVFLTLDLDTAVARVYADRMEQSRANEIDRPDTTLEDLKERLRLRLESERARYQEYYGIENHFDPKHFDLVIDTKANNADAVEKLILDGYKKWQSEK